MVAIEEGSVITGKYRLERLLARGGMGSVWIGRHVELGVTVAVKFIDSGHATSDSARTRFKREAKAAAQLKTPNVVQVYDYGVQDDTPYIVMELLEGEDLGARLKREGHLSPAAAAAILAPVCKAVHRAHEIGLVHRDLKPANIFLARQDDEVVVKVLDFGIAKWTDPTEAGESTKSGTMLGSPYYMSPEQARSLKDLDHRSDLWSIGVIAFQALTGQHPFGGDSLPSVIMAICAEPIPRPSQVAPGLAPEIDRFFERALARNPAKRFQSARELAEAFAALAPFGATAPGAPSASAASLGIRPVSWSAPSLSDSDSSSHVTATSSITSTSHITARSSPPAGGAERPSGVNTLSLSGNSLTRHPAPGRRTGVFLAGAAIAGILALGIVGFTFWRSTGPAPTAMSAATATPAPLAEVRLPATVEAHPIPSTVEIAPVASAAASSTGTDLDTGSAAPRGAPSGSSKPKVSVSHPPTLPSTTPRQAPSARPSAPPAASVGHGIF